MASTTAIVSGPATNVDSRNQRYEQIVKSSFTIAGSQALILLLGMVRNKAMAVILGPSGVGLAGLYTATLDLAVSTAGMGVSSSGVRQIAEAAGTGDQKRIARTAQVLRRVSLVLGITGALLLVLLAGPASTITFGTAEQAGSVALLGVAVLLRVLAAGELALLQGLREVAGLAKAGVAGAALGTLVAVPVLLILGMSGVVWSVVAMAALTLFGALCYSRKLSPALSSTAGTRQEAVALLKLGFAFMVSGLMMMGSAYFVRLVILRHAGVEATGHYQSAWSIGGMYVTFILQAMGADFYPRLTACAHDNPSCVQLVNDQAHVGLLLAGPGALATLTLAPFVITLFYSTTFGPAVDVLRWLSLGAALKVITWPMGFIILAKGRQNMFVWSEFAWTITSVLLTWSCVVRFGLPGAGMAFFLSYVIHGALIFVLVKRLCGFTWSGENLRTGMLYASVVTLIFCGFHILPLPLTTGFGVIATLVAIAYTLRSLARVLAADSLSGPIASLLKHPWICRSSSSTGTR
jgi:enterobacterial common antigen flippase